MTAEHSAGAGPFGEDRFRLLIQAVTDYAIYMLDRTGVVVSWNPGAERFKGYAEAEIIGQHFSRFYTDEDRATDLPRRALATAATEGRFEQEGWRVRKDGTRMWAHVVIDPIRDASGTLIGFAKITRDISARLAAQEALRASEERFRILVQGVTDYAIFMLDADGIVTNWNSGAARIKGYSEAEIVGQHFSRFYTEGDRAAGLPARALATAAREGRYEAEGWRLRKDGTRFWASVVIDAIRNEAGELVGYAKVTRDITERRKSQEDLEKTRASLFQAQKLEALGGLSSGIAHDFNNLLTVVLGNLDLLRRAPEEHRPRLIDNAIQAVEQGRRLTQQLLAFGRRHVLQAEVVDVNRLIRGMDDMLKQSLRGDIHVVLDLADGACPVEVDVTQLQTALINLAVNARDAMPKGGEFRIRTETVTGGSEAVSVEIAVSDTGHGMSPEVLARAFEPFFSTKDVGKGTGLGLPQVYGFAQQAKGSLRVASEVDQGTTFTIALPCTSARGAEAAEAGLNLGEVPRPLRILLVEDNAQVAEVAGAVLTERGHAVTATGDALEALRVLATDQPFDLVLSDLIMPGGLSGFDLAQRVRSRWPALPVLLATGYSDQAAKALGDGFPLISKPYEPAALLLAVERAAAPIAVSALQDNVVPLSRSAGER
ncbi:hybrid sensor histidine kinase/response regulator [Methylobacterium oxalidis]|uniref:histidine kinase n=1 Tax=Methylobacterium oxalidis TaxID=944322 RepID=A0A512J2Z2_9HYPH|nr:PAS domain-containing sensor histidine kinase [Methylobacterium oxalidis]GEP04326.1 histidine kinase [Methylobacterium oxalidis]GJE30605.1 Sensor histidine kinase RcsC [Methylobacterium oxalidis]GLS67155.1 histidine kinase [Methylobacterium oxalidis]